MAKSPLESILKKYQKTEQITEAFEDQISQETPQVPDASEVIDASEELRRLFMIMNPKTGRRFDIPLLDRNSPSYFMSYVDYMKMYEQDPVAFKKILEWN